MAYPAYPYETLLAPGTYFDRSGKITTGGTSQVLMASTLRRRIIIENPVSATSQGIATAENLFINFGIAASSTLGNSIELLPGGSYDSDSGPCTSDAIFVVAVTTNHQYMAKEMM